MTGISKSRLGLLLHSDPDKRSVMTLPELEKILHALGTNILQAYICIETFKGLELPDRERYATVISMLCEMFAGLPRKIIEALDEINRSEEHTSELQSLMRISYAVFCLK